jgi:GntR family transcriptional regulator
MAAIITPDTEVDPVGSTVRPREPAMTRWEALADKIREQIRTGQLGAGQLLPSYAELGRTGLDQPVSYGTVRMALAVLRAEGWVVGEQGVGVRVRADHPK